MPMVTMIQPQAIISNDAMTIFSNRKLLKAELLAAAGEAGTICLLLLFFLRVGMCVMTLMVRVLCVIETRTICAPSIDVNACGGRYNIVRSGISR